MGTFMKDNYFDGLTIDELWSLHLAISRMLSEKIIAEKNLITGRAKVGRTSGEAG